MKPGLTFRSLRVALPLAALAAVALLGPAPARAAGTGGLLQLQIDLADLVEQQDANSVAELEQRVARGLPPAALVALLDACREFPQVALEELLRDLARHRSAAIRARALMALARLGPLQAAAAVRAAADDWDRGLRRLAVVLGRLHPSERAATVVAQLMARDAELAAELNRERPVAVPREGAPDVPPKVSSKSLPEVPSKVVVR